THRVSHSFPTRRSSDLVAVVDRQFLHVGAGELARAAAADPRVHLERPLAVALLALGCRAAGFSDDAVQAGVVGRWHYGVAAWPRSEEHTSELQSRENLV